MSKLGRNLLLLALSFAMTGISPTYATDANPTVTITSPSAGAVAKGVLSIGSQFAADPSGTASITKIGISIASAPSGYTNLLTLGGYTSGSGALGSTSVDAYWSNGYFSGSSATFKVDTTAWPAGSYSITVTVLDSNGRTTTSSPVSFIIPKGVLLTTNVISYDGNQVSISATIPGVSSLDGGQVQLLISDARSGPFVPVGSFTGGPDKLLFNGPIQISKWVRASLTGAASLLDSLSEPTQILAMPKISCSVSSKAKVYAKVNGLCKFSFSVNGVNVALNVDSGKGWHSLGSGTVKGLTFPISIVGKSIGILKVQITSSGIPGVYQSFSSNIMTVKVVK